MIGKLLDAGMPHDDAFVLGYIARSAGHPGRAGVGDSIDRGLILAHTLRQYGYAIVRLPEGRTTDVPVTQIETPVMETWPPAMAYAILGDAEARQVLLDAGWREPVAAAPEANSGGANLATLQDAALDFVGDVQRELLSKDENLLAFPLGSLGRLLALLDPAAQLSEGRSHE